ncbi:MAG TPA: hypothetical protein VE907_08635 [Gammaproteobacteria bacterium]|nr:hypothetical protein [Gammaproteobacteria bacterium]
MAVQDRPHIPWWRTKGNAFFVVVMAESKRIGAMLLGKDVNEATLAPGNRGRVDVAGNPA